MVVSASIKHCHLVVEQNSARNTLHPHSADVDERAIVNLSQRQKLLEAFVATTVAS